MGEISNIFSELKWGNFGKFNKSNSKNMSLFSPPYFPDVVHKCRTIEPSDYQNDGSSQCTLVKKIRYLRENSRDRYWKDYQNHSLRLKKINKIFTYFTHTTKKVCNQGEHFLIQSMFWFEEINTVGILHNSAPNGNHN